MTHLDLDAMFLNGLPVYGPGLLGLVALACALGVPLPMQILLLGAGALAHEGRLDPRLAVAGCLAGSLAGETFYYVAGRVAGGWVQRRAGGPLAGAWHEARRRFRDRAGRTVYLTRFALTPLGIPTSLVAGGEGYAYWRFAGIAIAGDLVWILGYGGAGFLLGPAWPGLAVAIERYSRWFGAVALAAFVLSCVLLSFRSQIARAISRRRVLRTAPNPASYQN